MEAVGFIGDVHGDLRLLEQLVALAVDEAKELIFLGDYVNRGRQSRQVLDFLVELRAEAPRPCQFLLGNHDAAFLQAIDDERLDAFLRIGGAATLSSYPAPSARPPATALRDRVPKDHVAFLRSLAPSTEGDDYFASHDPQAGVAVGTSKFGIHGHLPQVALVPQVTETRALIDTGCGTLPDGRLTCFLLPSRRWIQSA